MSTDNIIVFDTTLRDGEQAPGCSMNTSEKLEVARVLVELGVDVIEAGFPIASPGDFEAVQLIAREFGDRSIICGLARCRKDDIDRAWGALKDAENVRLHVFLATSAIHREFKLKMDKSQIVETAVEMVKRAAGYCEDVEFSPEDAARTELDFLCEVVEKAIEAGATTVNIPDTVGYATPSHFEKVITHLKQNVSNIDKAVISCHCHNDLGLAVANSLAAVEAGARQVECTINGLGERAGNAALEEIVMALRTRKDYYGCDTKIDTTKLFHASQLVSRTTGLSVQRNKAIVGQNAFAHEAGIHQHGILQERSTYEIMRPEDVGYIGENLVLGKHSGRHAFRDRVTSLGYDLDDEVVQQIFDDFIDLADKKKDIYDSDIVALIENRSGTSLDRWKFVSCHASAGSGTIPTATVALEDENGEEHRDAATGGGPIEAVLHAMERVIGLSATLEDLNIRSVSKGKDALGEVSVVVRVGGKPFHGRGLSVDIIEGSALAYLNALNKADIARQQQKHRAAETA